MQPGPQLCNRRPVTQLDKLRIHVEYIYCIILLSHTIEIVEDNKQRCFWPYYCIICTVITYS